MAFEQLEDRRLLVIGGTDFATSVPRGGEFDGVAVLYEPISGGPRYGCTGALLNTARHILSAAHCFDADGTSGMHGAERNSTAGFDLKRGAMAINIDVPIMASQIAIHPNWNGNFRDGNDVSIMTLADPVVTAPNRHLIAPFGAQRYSIYGGSNEVGQNFTIVGYGETGTGFTGNQRDEVQRVTITNPLSTGTFTLTFMGQTTTAIPQNANSQTVAAALRALSTIGPAMPGNSNVLVDNKGLPIGSWNIRFVQGLHSKNVDAMTGIATHGRALNVETRFDGNLPGIVGVKRRGENRYDSTAIKSTSLRWDFDNGSDSGFTGRGDSGGPAFIRNTTLNRWEIASIASYVDPNPADINNYMDDSGMRVIDHSYGEVAVSPRISSYNRPGGFIRTATSGRYHLVLDMMQQALGQDGLTENLTITARKVGSELQIEVSNESAPGVFSGVYYSAPITDIESLTIRGGDDHETIRILSSPKTLTIDGRGGQDQIFVNQNTTSITVSGGANDDTISLLGMASIATISGDQGNDTVNVRGSISYINIAGGTNDDTVNIETLPAGANAIFYGESGNDTLNLSRTLGNLNNIRGNVEFVGGNMAGRLNGDSMNIWDHGNSASNRTYELDTGKFTSPGLLSTVTYRQVGSVIVSASPGENATANIFGTSEDTKTAVQNAAKIVVGGPEISTPGLTTRHVKGPLSLTSNRAVDLTIDDSATSIAHNVRLTGFRVEGLTDYSISFLSLVLSSLTIKTGNNVDTFTVVDTRDAERTRNVFLHTGGNADRVNIQRNRTILQVEGVAGADVVNLGANGIMQYITGQVLILNEGNYSTINLNDSADTEGRAVTLDVVNDPSLGTLGRVTGLAPGNILFKQADLRALNIWGSQHLDFFRVNDTAKSGVAGGSVTTIHSGFGADTVQVLATTGELAVNLDGSNNYVTVGGNGPTDGSLNRIMGKVSIRGNQEYRNNFLDIVDGASTGSYVYQVETGRTYRTNMNGSGRTADIDYSRYLLDGFELTGSNNGNQFNIIGTPYSNPGVVRGGVNLRAGNGNDSVNVFGTTGGRLNVDLGIGASQRVMIGDATRSLDNITGDVHVSGGGFVDTFVSDAASTTAHRAVFERDPDGEQIVRRFGVDTIGNEIQLNRFTFDFDQQSRIDYRTGRVVTGPYNQINVNGVIANTEVVVNGGANNEVFSVGFGGSTTEILSHVTFNSGGGQDLAYYYDMGKTTPSQYTVRDNPPSPNGMVVGSAGQPDVVFNGLSQLHFYAPSVGGNTTGISSVPENLFLVLVAADGDQLTVGNKVPGLPGTMENIKGILQVSGYTADGAVTLNLDDSANTTVARDVSIVDYQGQYPWSAITGLTGNATMLIRDHDEWNVNIRGGSRDDRFVMRGASLAANYSIDGGAGNDVLIGSGGNRLYGGAGRDLLVAGSLASVLDGGLDEDILIGGSLNDTSTSNADAIRDLWTNIDLTYEFRVSILLDTLLSSDRVTGNGSRDSLTGGLDAIDLFFGEFEDALIGDLVTDWQEGEQIVERS